MRNKLEIGTKIYHPCSVDILEYKVISIAEYEYGIGYTLKATHNIGACGRVEVYVSQDKKDNLRFSGLSDDWEHIYDSGLQDFVEGIYYVDRDKARLEYYEKQRILVWTKLEERKRLYDDAKYTYDKVEKIIKQIKETLK